MSNSAPEGNEPQGHPAWQSILDKLPEDLHSIVKPELEAWDRGVQDKLQGVRSQYDPYKDLVDNQIDPQQVQQALYIANHLQTNPQEFVQKAIETFGLDYVQAQLQSQQDDEDDDPYDQYGADITKDPRYKALESTVQELQGKWTERETLTQQEQQAKEFETYLDGLSEANKERGEFDRTYVTALMAQGIKGEQAVEQFYNTVNQAAARIAGVPNPNNQQQSTPPKVMGSEGNTGSGLPSDPVNMGDLKRNDVDALVVEMLNRMNNQT